MNDIYIGAYWGARKETIAQCSNRAKRMFDALTICDQVFSKWFEKGMSRKEALKQSVDGSNEIRLRDILLKERHRSEDGKTIVDDLGFGIYLWNGETTKTSASISVKCGLYCENPRLSNAVVLTLPKDLGNLTAAQNMLPVFLSIVEAWEPERAGVISEKSRDSRNYVPRTPFVDWMVYIAGKEVNPATLPKPSIAYPVAHGSIIVVQNEPIQFDNPEHIRNVHAVEKYLGLNPS